MLKDIVKQLCKSNHITIMKLESDLELGSGTVAKWDKAIPKVDTVTKVANYFNVSVDYLLGRTEEPAPISALPNGKFDFQLFKETSPGEYETSVDDLIKRAMELLSQMDEEHKKAALLQLEALAALNRK